MDYDLHHMGYNLSAKDPTGRRGILDHMHIESPDISKDTENIHK